MSQPSGYKIFGAIAVLLLMLVALPLVIFLGAYVSINIVLLILAAHYWAAFWWSCLYSLFYLAGVILKALNGD